MAHGDAREEKWRGNKRMEWVTSKCHMTAEQRLARAVQTLQADVHSSAASSRLNWRPCWFKWTRLCHQKTKSGFCACAITSQMQSTLLFTRNKRHLPFSTAFPHSHTLTFHDAAPFSPPVLHTCPVSLAGTVNAWKATVPRDSHPTPMFMLSLDLRWG
jgi:hypothetical protein